MSDHSFDLDSLLRRDDFVRALCRSIVVSGSSDPDASDAQQDAWVKALSSRGRFRPSSLPAWLRAVARNRRRSVMRADRARRKRERQAVCPPSTPTPEEILAREELRRRVIEAVLALEERYRVPVLRRYMQGESPEEIASSLGVPVQTVWTRLHRARAILRERLEPDDPSNCGGIAALAGLPDISTSVTYGFAMSAKAVGSALAAAAVLVIVFLGVRGGMGTGVPGPTPSPPPSASDDERGRGSEHAASSRGHAAEVRVGAPRHEVRDPNPPSVATVRGRVVDRRGDAIAGALVERIEDDSGAVFTNADGEFELVGFAIGSTVRASAAGRIAKEIRIWPGEEPTIVLHPGALVRGVVLDASTSEPLAGATISGGPQRDVADEEGRFEIALPPVVRWFSISHGDEYVPWTANPLLADRDRELVVRLPRVEVAARRYLHIVDGETGDALESVLATPGCITHVDGAVWLADMVRYPHGLHARVIAGGHIGVNVDENGKRGEGPSDPILVRLPSPATLRGRVADTDGRPVSGAEVRARLPVLYPVWGQDIDAGAISWGDTTGEDGAFSITGPPPFHGVRLSISHPSFAHAVRTLAADETSDSIDIALDVGHSLVGLVQRAGDDAPVEGARVFTAEGRVAITDRDGRFALHRLPDEVKVTVRADGLVPVEYSMRRPPTVEPLVIALESGGAISGIVVDSPGNAVPYAVIDVRALRLDGDERGDLRPAEQRRECEADGEGRFQLDHLATGAWSLEATTAPGLHSWRHDLQTTAHTGDASVRLVAHGLTGVSFRVFDRTTGEPIVRTRCFSPTGSVSYSNANASTFLELRPDIPSTVGVTAPGYTTELRDGVVVAPGELREELFQLEPAEDLRGLLQDPRGRPHAHATLTLRPAGAHDHDALDVTATTDADGEFVARGVVPGEWDVLSIRVAVGEDERPLLVDTPRLTLLRGDTERTLVADFPPGRTMLRGFVPLLDGTIRATVILEPPGMRAPVDERGYFVAERVPAGRVGISLECDRGREGTVTRRVSVVEVAEGGVIDVDLRSDR